jgi:heptaprenyl diphosphate synthase
MHAAQIRSDGRHRHHGDRGAARPCPRAFRSRAAPVLRAAGLADTRQCGGDLRPEPRDAAAFRAQRPERRPMTHSTIELPVTEDDYRIARYAAAAIALSVAEAALPSPLPGIKPGLANIIVLVVLARYGWRDAAWVSLLRVVAGSLVIGQFLAPGFFLALAGALVQPRRAGAGAGFAGALVRPGLGQRAGGLRPHRRATGPGPRLAGAARRRLVFLLPLFATAALLFGTINGLVAARLLAPPVADSKRHDHSAVPAAVGAVPGRAAAAAHLRAALHGHGQGLPQGVRVPSASA